MAKQKWQSADGNSYDPALIRLMQMVFDDVCGSQPDSARAVSDGDRETVANAILALINRGERDPAALRVHALDQLNRFRNPGHLGRRQD